MAVRDNGGGIGSEADCAAGLDEEAPTPMLNQDSFPPNTVVALPGDISNWGLVLGRPIGYRVRFYREEGMRTITFEEFEAQGWLRSFTGGRTWMNAKGEILNL
jgi:hypothetical protein